MHYKNIHRLEKFKNIQEPRVEEHTFSRTIQDQIKFKNIQEHSRILRTSGHLVQVKKPYKITKLQNFITFDRVLVLTLNIILFMSTNIC